VGPIIDGKAPRIRPETAVEDGTRVLVQRIEIHNPLRRDMTVEHEENGSFIEHEGKPLAGILHQSLVRLLGHFIHSAVIPISKIGGEVGLRSGDVTLGWDSVEKNAREVVDHTWVDRGVMQLLDDNLMIPMLSHMGPTQPPHQVGHTPIEVQEGGGIHGNTMVINRGLRGPVGIKPLGPFERDITEISKEIFQ
jgi:hypothetical protein